MAENNQHRLQFMVDGVGHTSYIWEVITLAKMDWVSRHQRFRNLRSRTRNAVMERMSPDMLLQGTRTGSWPDRWLIPLADKVMVQTCIEEYFVVHGRFRVKSRRRHTLKRLKQTSLHKYFRVRVPGWEV